MLATAAAAALGARSYIRLTASHSCVAIPCSRAHILRLSVRRPFPLATAHPSQQQQQQEPAHAWKIPNPPPHPRRCSVVQCGAVCGNMVRCGAARQRVPVRRDMRRGAMHYGAALVRLSTGCAVRCPHPLGPARMCTPTATAATPTDRGAVCVDVVRCGAARCSAAWCVPVRCDMRRGAIPSGAARFV